MNNRPSWVKFRSNSVPLSSDHLHIRPKELAEFVDLAVKMRMRAKKRALVTKMQKRNSDGIPHTPCLMPRLGIIDDKSNGRIYAKLEIPDVDPKGVELKLRGETLTVSGERQPNLPCVPAEYEAALRLHSQTVIGDQRPKIIMLGGGRVTSMSVPQRPSQPNESGTMQEQQHVHSDPPSFVYYNELRYGPFLRNLRVPSGTRAKDIDVMFQNGMLVISWPKAVAHQSSSKTHYLTESGEVIPITSDMRTTTPVLMRVESADV